MLNRVYKTISFSVVIMILVWSFVLHAGAPDSQDGQVKHKPRSIKTLGAGWAWGMTEAGKLKSKNGFIIGYTIRRLMGERSFTGSWSMSDKRKSLNELVYGVKLPNPYGYMGDKSIQEMATGMLKEKKSPKGKEKKILKDLALLFFFNAKGTVCEQIKVSNMELVVDLEGERLYWLGPAKTAESVAMAIDMYRKGIKKSGTFSASDLFDLKKRLIMAVAMHQNDPAVFPFLKGILIGKEDGELRGKAAFWLGESQVPAAAKLLIHTALNDSSEEVRKKSVFGLYLHRSQEATNGLINLARKASDRDVRKKAIFWLGQKAVKRSAEILADVVYNDKDAGIQKSAVFALSQLSDGKGVSSLIKIAKTHKSLTVKKKAIFWLSQCDDPRALDTIVQLIEK
jgi:HEAT repeat protein